MNKSATDLGDTILKRDILFLVVIAAIALCVRLYNFKLPGYYNDEAVFVNPTMRMLQGLMLSRYPSIHLFGHDFLLMGSQKTGPIVSYYYAPFIYLFKDPVFATRLASATIAVLTIIIAFYFSKELFNKRVAYITALLLAISPSFVFYSRTGWTNLMATLITILCFLFLLRWYTQKRDIYFYLGCLSLGVGLQYLTFLWVIGALVLSKLILKIKMPKVGLKQITIGLFAFFIGFSPIAYYNLSGLLHGSPTTISFLINNLGTTWMGHSNLNFCDNILIRINTFKILLEGSAFTELGNTYHDYFFIFLFIAAFFMLTCSLFLSNSKKILNIENTEKLKIKFILLIILIVLGVSIFTVSILSPYNLLIILPFCMMTVAKFLESIPKKKIMFVILIIAVLMNIYVIYNYYGSLEKSGGVGTFSDAIYPLTDYLEENNIENPIAVDWGFKYNLQVLTDQRINPIEVFSYAGINVTNVYFVSNLKQCFTNPDNVYLFHSPQYTQYIRYWAFEELAHGMNKSIVLKKTFYQRDGRPVILLYKVIDEEISQINIGKSRSHPNNVPFMVNNTDRQSKYIWIEAENDTFSQGTYLDLISRGRFGLTSGIEHYVRFKGSYSEYKFNIENPGKYSIWVRVGAYAPLQIILDNIDRGVIKPASSNYTWYDIGHFYLQKNTIHALRIASIGKGYSMYDAILITNNLDYVPESINKPINPWGKPHYTIGEQGYYIWQDEQGWHIRWTSDSNKKFIGQITANKKFMSITEYDLELEDKIESSNNTIWFEGFAKDEEDGIDITAKRIIFDIYIQ